MGEYIIRQDVNKQNVDKDTKPKTRRFSSFFSSALITSLLLFSSPNSAKADYDSADICPKGSRATTFTLSPGEKCRGDKYGNICWECRTKDGKVLNTNIEDMQEKVDKVINSAPPVGKTYTKNEINQIKNNVNKWDKAELEKLIKKLNGNLNDEERTIFRGALEHWPDIKYHSMRLGIDPRISYLVAVAESRLIQKVGSSGEVSPMQIMPETMVLMFNRYGRNDEYIKKIIKEGKNWRKDKVAQMILALYYLRDGISTVGPANSKLEQLNSEDLLMIYHFYNRGHNRYVVDNWWQGDNFATCTKKYLRLYPEIDKFIEEFLKMNKEERSIISKTWNAYFDRQKKMSAKNREQKIQQPKQNPTKNNNEKQEKVMDGKQGNKIDEKQKKQDVKIEGIMASTVHVKAEPPKTQPKSEKGKKNEDPSKKQQNKSTDNIIKTEQNEDKKYQKIDRNKDANQELKELLERINQVKEKVEELKKNY